MKWLRPSELGWAVRNRLASLGFGARLFVRLLGTLGATFKRPGLLRDQVHFMGNYPLAIIAVSGTFVGFRAGIAGLLHLAALWLFGGPGAVGCAQPGARVGAGHHRAAVCRARWHGF